MAKRTAAKEMVFFHRQIFLSVNVNNATGFPHNPRIATGT
jgi:hypothetical protein